eukprot:Gb_25524 [translate_table: standard]
MEQAIVPVLFQTEFDVKTEAFFVGAVGIHNFWNRETRQSELCSRDQMEDEEEEEDEATELWKERSLKSDFMEWTMDKAMAAFTCPLLGICLAERTAIFYYKYMTSASK